jgi:TolA-binding protein
MTLLILFRKFVWLFLIFAIVSTAGAAEKIHWFHNYDQALAESRKTSKPILVDCFADWCYWCHKLDENVYTDAKFIKFSETIVPLRIDVEDKGEGTRLAEQYQLTGLPTLLVIDSEGKLLNRIGGYLEPADLINDITTMQDLLDQEQKQPDDPALLYKIAREYVAREMNPEAERRFKKILQSPDAPAALKDSAQFSLALTQFYQRKLDDSLATIQKYRTDYPQAESAEDALLLLSEIYLEKDSNELARQTIKEFLVKYPKSDNVRRAQEVLATLDENSRAE